MHEPALLADHIDEQTDTILAVWRATVERGGDVPEAERLSYREFVDHVPALLDRLADRLRGRPADATTEGKKHGVHRWCQGYDIGEVITEFAHLRTALGRSTVEHAAERGWDLDRLAGAFEAIDEVLSEATAESVRQFQDEALRQGELFRTITETQGEGLCTLDMHGRVTFLNAAAERLLGWSRHELIGRHLDAMLQFLRPDGSSYSAEECPLTLVLRSGQPTQGDEIFVRRDGTRITVAYIATPIERDGLRDGLVVVLRDISERIAQEVALKQERERAEEASQHKTRLIAALSHDVRTPLNAVVLAAQLLEFHFDGKAAPPLKAEAETESKTEANAEVDECLRTIRHSVRNVLDLLGDLLDLSKLDAGVVQLEVAPFPLQPVLVECLASIEPQARMKGLDIAFEPDDLAAGSLETDRAKLKQIVSNFLSNAVRYTERGQIRLEAVRVNGQVRIAVADTGVGIDPKDHGRIFDEFAVLEQPRRANAEGTGLGLAICRRLAGLLGGEILLESAPGQGSTFSLVLPASAIARDEARPASDATPPTTRTGVGTIVVAEDHDQSRQTLARLLRRIGYRVLEASNGREAVDLIAAEATAPWAVLMDVNMPEMDGVEATLALRADPRFPGLPIFALTGDVTLDNQQRIGEAGVDGYLEKPVTLDLLKQALASLGPETPGPTPKPR